MTALKAPRTPARHRVSARLGTETGVIATAELVDFAERLTRDAAGPGARLTGATVHLLQARSAGQVTADAVQLSRGGAPVWRVTISDETGAVLAEVTTTLAFGDAPGPAPAQPPDDAAEPERRHRPEARRERIARAARDVFAERGYTAATMREVAAAAGMHVPTMYQYVRSKEEILELVYAWTIRQAVEGMDPVLSARGPSLDRIEAVVRRLLEVNQELRRGTLVMNRETRSLSRAARDRVLGDYAGMVGRIGKIIAEGQDEGVFRRMDPDIAAVFIDALADVWVLRPFAFGHTDYETYAAELAAFVRGALTGDAAQVPEEPGRTHSTHQQETER